MFGSIKWLFLLTAALTLLVAGACAPVTYHRYQPAHPIGQGEWKVTASAETGRDMIMPAETALHTEMESELWDYRFENDEDLQLADVFVDIVEVIAFSPMLMLGSMFGLPEYGLDVGYGVTDSFDMYLGVTGSGYVHGNGKVRLASFGEHGALSLAPGAGFLLFDSGPFDGEENNLEYKDSYSGSVITAELPLLIGWQFEKLSPYFALHTSYHRVNIEYRREISELDPDFDATIDFAYDVLNVGLTAGLQIKLGHFLLTPEILALYAVPMQDDVVPVVFLSPGIAIGAQW